MWPDSYWGSTGGTGGGGVDSAAVTALINSTVTKPYVDLLDVDAVTLADIAANNYALKTDVTNSITSTVTKAYVDLLDVDAVTLNNVAASLYALKADIPTGSDVTTTVVDQMINDTVNKSYVDDLMVNSTYFQGYVPSNFYQVGAAITQQFCPMWSVAIPAGNNYTITSTAWGKSLYFTDTSPADLTVTIPTVATAGLSMSAGLWIEILNHKSSVYRITIAAGAEHNVISRYTMRKISPGGSAVLKSVGGIAPINWYLYGALET